MNFLEVCKNVIAIDSSPTNGTGELCRYLKTVAESMGFHVRLEDDVQRGLEQANIICSTEPYSPNIHLMLQTHLDTVDPGSFALWDRTGRNPFQASIHDGKLYGLGAADTKLDFLCKLFAAQKFLKKSSTKTFAVVGTFGEEDSMQGAVRLIRHKTLIPKFALVGEPTNFHLVYAGKGLANLEITIPFSQEEIDCRIQHDTSESQTTQSKIFRGKAAHSSFPHKGENALEKVFNFMRQLPDQLLVLEVDGGTNHNTIPIQAVLEFDVYPLKEKSLNQKIVKIFETILLLKSEFFKNRDPRFEPDLTTFNIGMARTFSDHFKVMGCVRWPAGVSEETYTQWMEKLQDHCQSIGAIFRVRDFKKPFITDIQSPFSKDVLSCIQKINPTSQYTTQPVTNEANVFHKFGIPSLVFGPGVRDQNSQTPHESIEISDLEKAQTIYEQIIEQICF